MPRNESLDMDQEWKEAGDSQPSHRMKFRGQLVNIYVGANKQRWVVHEDVLRKHSEVFKNALDYGVAGLKTELHIFCTRGGGYKKESEGSKPGCEVEIHLVEEDQKMFAHFVDWLYGEHLFTEEYYENSEKSTVDHAKEWAALHCFAFSIKAKTLADHALAEYLAHIEARLPDMKEIQLIWNRSTKNSPLRQHVIDAFVVDFHGRSSDDIDQSFIFTIGRNGKFLRDLLNGIKQHGQISIKDCKITRCSVHKKGTRAVRGGGSLQGSPATPANPACSAAVPALSTPFNPTTPARHALPTSPSVLSSSRYEAKELHPPAKTEHVNMFSPTGPREFLKPVSRLAPRIFSSGLLSRDSYGKRDYGRDADDDEMDMS